MEPRIDPANVAGWGIDADPDNDPTYPMRQRQEGKESGVRDETWQRPALQAQSVEVLHSNERPNLTAAFGTSTPPAGLSGMIRRRAFRHSESTYSHWLPLMLADRIGVVEGLLADLRQGHVPNIFAEKGWPAEWQHNRKQLITRVAVGSAVLAAAAIWLRRSRR